MKINVQELEFSKYNKKINILRKDIEIDEKDILCLMLTKKYHVTKNNFIHDDIDISYENNKTIIYYKEIKIFTNDGCYKKFNIYENKSLDIFIKEFRNFIKEDTPLIFDNFIGYSVLSFNNDNYCYLDRSKIIKSVIKDGHKQFGVPIYEGSKLSDLICEQKFEDCINFKVLELDLGVRKIELNMYQNKTLQHNEIYAPGLEHSFYVKLNRI